MKQMSDSVPTIQVDLASPQSPDSLSLLDELQRADQRRELRRRPPPDEEEGGLMMRPPQARGGDQGEEGGPSAKEQRLQRCLSDPGPSAEDDEDEPFLS